MIIHVHFKSLNFSRGYFLVIYLLYDCSVICSCNIQTSIRAQVVDKKYARLVNLPTRHPFEHVMLYTIFKRALSPLFTTCQFMASSWHVLMTSFERTCYPCSAEQGQGYQWSITLFSRTDTRLLGKFLHFYKE